MTIPTQTLPISDQLAAQIQGSILNNLAGGPGAQATIYNNLAGFCQTQESDDTGGNNRIDWPNTLADAFYPNGAGAVLQQQGTNSYNAAATTWQTLRFMAHWLVDPGTNSFAADPRADQFLSIINPTSTPAQRTTMITNMLAAINASFPGGTPGDLVLSMSP